MNSIAYKPRSGEVQSQTPGGKSHTLRWTEWGRKDNPRLLVCAHGLSRNARDFDFLARRLAGEYRIICPDYPGRGDSDWLENPGFYNNHQYFQDTLCLLDSLQYQSLDWVGTSMGGLIGMALAAYPGISVGKLVVNDVGPHIPAASLELIKNYLKVHPVFADKAEAERYFREVYASFGKLDDIHYQHLVKHGICAASNGSGFRLNYDPKIIDSFVNTPVEDVNIWSLWLLINCPVLIIRGAMSGLLLGETVSKMKQLNRRAKSVEFAGCGHAPSLMMSDQIEFVADWLLEKD